MVCRVFTRGYACVLIILESLGTPSLGSIRELGCGCSAHTRFGQQGLDGKGIGVLRLSIFCSYGPPGTSLKPRQFKKQYEETSQNRTGEHVSGRHV